MTTGSFTAGSVTAGSVTTASVVAAATYIPELADFDADGFGASVVSVHGRVPSAGDVDRPSTTQSASTPFVYALAISELGLDEVHRHVGFEPSGEPFDAISLDPDTGRPDNPLINAGAIVTLRSSTAPTCSIGSNGSARSCPRALAAAPRR